MKTKVTVIVIVLMFLVMASFSYAEYKPSEFFVVTEYAIARMGPGLEHKQAFRISPGNMWVILSREGDWIQILDDPAVYVYEKFGEIESIDSLVQKYLKGR